MPSLLYKSVPLCKDDVTYALEAGVDGIIVPAESVQLISSLARCNVLADEDLVYVKLESKAEEEHATALLQKSKKVVIAHGWEIIPIENLLAQSERVAVEVKSFDEATLAAGILERGVSCIVLLPESSTDLKRIVSEIKSSQGKFELQEAVVTKVQNIGLGHRVCVDTLSLFNKGQGMLIGNSSAFTFLVHAETEDNEYVAARPFRVNAGGVHSYVQMPLDRTKYLQELGAGDEVLQIDAKGNSALVTVGRIKIEIRPMLYIEARIGDKIGGIFLQNAETIRLTKVDGEPISVVNIECGLKILCHTDTCGRHFGMRIVEDIQEL